MKTDFEMIFAVVNRGYAEMVMHEARNCGASGGTIIHGRGTGQTAAKNLFNFEMENEKDLIMIIANHEIRNKIMTEIMKHAGLNTEAHGIVFSLPVEDFTMLKRRTNTENIKTSNQIPNSSEKNKESNNNPETREQSTKPSPEKKQAASSSEKEQTTIPTSEKEEKNAKPSENRK